MKALRFVFPAFVGSILGLSSCSSYQQQAGLIGGLAGAGLGAAFGDDHQDVIAGAAVGAAVGAGGAALHEDSRRRHHSRFGPAPESAPPQGVARPSGPPTAIPDPETPAPSHPLARRTANPDEVLSPYPPYKRINVSGFRSGQLAKDPRNGRIFQIP